ncbi:XRE family transcriptional regulator [Pseudomonas fluorescens]|nr:XRE family transcriptional regulator [Pseudomonas fluorescens]
MSEIEESTGNVYQDLGLEHTGEMLLKSEYATKLVSLIESSDMSESEAAQRLGIPLENLQQILRGKFREVPVTTMAEYKIKISGLGSGATGSPLRREPSPTHQALCTTASLSPSTANHHASPRCG